MTAEASVRQRKDLIAFEVSEEIIRRSQSILVRGRERLLVGLDQPLVLVDSVKSLADLRAFGRAGLGNRKRGQMHRIIGVGNADCRGDIGQRPDRGTLLLPRVQPRRSPSGGSSGEAEGLDEMHL